MQTKVSIVGMLAVELRRSVCILDSRCMWNFRSKEIKASSQEKALKTIYDSMSLTIPTDTLEKVI